MFQSAGELLLQSKARSAVLKALFVDRKAASVSELARAAGLSAFGVAREVRFLKAAGLIEVVANGAADKVRGRLNHPIASPLRALLSAPLTPPTSPTAGKALRESLVFWGAPLANVAPKKHFALEATVLLAVDAARDDGTVFRVLPVVVARHVDDLDWSALREGARAKKLKAEVGMVVALTAALLKRPELNRHVVELRDDRRHTLQFFPRAHSEFEKALARQRTPAPSRRWGFLSNVSLESFQKTMDQALA